MDFMTVYQRWLTETEGNEELTSELQSIANDAAAIEDRFYRDMEFGTGGLRGILGAGTNRMNLYTVAKATQGYSDYLTAHFPAPSVAVAYDSRINSDVFASLAASVFAANGISVHIYPKLMPTPALSFAVRILGCSGGIVITASHNPARYNGYKVYGPDGCQITTEAAAEIQKCIDVIDPFDGVSYADFVSELAAGRIAYIGEDTVTRYLLAVGAASVLPENVARDVAIVYTPLNGTGVSCVPQCLREHGFTNIILPDEQKTPDGKFPTCPYPNPEIREALAVGLEWAERTGSDLLLATDPDCDRVGAAVKDGDGYTLISGNEMGVLLLDFVCRMRISNRTMPKKPVAVKTIVTTPMAARIAGHYGVELRDVLTGFKFIGEQIGLLEKSGDAERYIFGFEESYGYLSGSFVRDKDAVNASLLICEMFAWYKAQGKTLISALRELYETYGHYCARLISFAFEGNAGMRTMQKKMDKLRNSPPKELAGLTVTAVGDYLASVTKNANGGETPIVGLPKSNLLRFYMRGGAEAVIRPSGTEPKLKVYLTAIGTTAQECAATAESLATWFADWV